MTQTAPLDADPTNQDQDLEAQTQPRLFVAAEALAARMLDFAEAGFLRRA